MSDRDQIFAKVTQAIEPFKAKSQAKSNGSDEVCLQVSIEG